MRDVGIAHSRQFTGGIFAGVSMTARAVSNNLGGFIWQQSRRQFFDLLWRDIQRSGDVGFAVTFRGQRFNHSDRFLSIKFCPEILCRNCGIHIGFSSAVNFTAEREPLQLDDVDCSC